MANSEELEVKIAFLEEALATISEEHFAQQKELRQLKEQMDLLVKKVRNIQNNDSSETEVVDETPPHY
ncbi:MAG: SlyX family protein [Acidiferrobacterales bacterium]|nr:SlyX family protein [Acidiferrobacterales bacterium]